MSTMAIGPAANHGGAVVIPFPARRLEASGRASAQRRQPAATPCPRPAQASAARQGGLARHDGAEAPAPLRLTPRGRRVVALLSLLLVSAFALIGTKAVAGGPERALEVQAYTVAAGDTMWELAAQLAAPGEDVRDVIRELVELNGASSAGLTAGQRILLPVER